MPIQGKPVLSAARVLAVDDSRLITTLVERALADEFQVVTANSGSDCLNILAADSNFQVIILDVLMDDINGMDLCRRIKATSEWSHIPIIFLSGLDEPSEIEQVLEAGGCDFVLKPFNGVELKESIRLHTQFRATQCVRPERNTGRVLLLEDDRVTSASVQKFLELQGNDVHALGSGDSIIEILDRFDPDVVITDIEMPGLNGFQVTSQIKQSRRHQHIPVLIISGQTDRETVLRGLQVGAEDFVRKPFNMEELNARVRNFIRYKNLVDVLHRTSEYARHRDSVTGLANKTSIMSHIESVGHRNGSAALLLVRIHDHAKLTQAYGEKVSDLALKTLAACLEDALPMALAVGRVESDVFAIVLETYSETRAMRIAEWIGELLDKPIHVGRNEFRWQCTIGFAIMQGHELNSSAALRRAMMALYHAKDHKPVAYDAQMEDSETLMLQLESDLFGAAERNELQLFYQPQVSLTTGEISGVEALLRWIHPKRGMVSPSVFIPISERIGAISRIGSWVTQKACSDWKQLNRELGMSIPISINISPVQFRDHALVSDLSSTISKTNIPFDALELEITESCSMSDVSQSLDILGSLGQCGFRLSMDDFGTGYSSLSYLSQFPLNTLKIDRSFVGNVVNDNRSRAVTSCIVSLAKGLSLNIVAEGVENQEQMRYLKNLGCQTAQGYLFSPPVRFESFKAQFADQVFSPRFLELETGGTHEQ
ncbi:MAG: EAL domain-containing protein [Acidobacteria bacterium]|nr:EAL domain-containing protein [Acidobacteriota bacterium]